VPIPVLSVITRTETVLSKPGAYQAFVQCNRFLCWGPAAVLMWREPGVEGGALREVLGGLGQGRQRGVGWQGSGLRDLQSPPGVLRGFPNFFANGKKKPKRKSTSEAQ